MKRIVLLTNVILILLSYIRVSNAETECPAGKYFSSSSNTCLNCSAGYYCPKGSTSGYANPCPAGTFSKAGQAECTPCPEGTYSSSGSPTCQACAGTTNKEKGATSCNIECGAGFILNTNYGRCESCEKGYSCSEGSTSKYQNRCPAGTYSLGGASECVPCPKGTYQYSSGASYCIACDGVTNKETGATSCTKNNPQIGCTAGAFWNGTACSQCPFGYYCPGGVAEPVQCSGDYVSSRNARYEEDCSGVDVTLPCPAGQYMADKSKGLCSACPEGYYCPDGFDRTVCPAGTYSRSGASSAEECTPCPKGTYQHSTGYACRACDGVTNQETGATSCSFNCPTGTMRWGNECTSAYCYEGYICEDGERKECPSGTFSIDGGTECISCPAGTYQISSWSAHGSSKVCVICPNGKVSISGSTSCADSCPAGTFQDGIACNSFPKGCSDYDVESSKCVTCKEGYSKYNGQCIKDCDEGELSKDGACVDAENGCGDGYLRKKNTCIPEENGCGKDYAAHEGECIEILKTRYTLPEADELTSDDNENMIEWIFE